MSEAGSADVDEYDVVSELPQDIKPTENVVKSSRRRRTSFVVERIVGYCATLIKAEFAGQSNTKECVRFFI